MKNKILTLGFILLFTTLMTAQTNRTSSSISPSINVTKYVIGIGNVESKMFYDVLNVLQNSSSIKVYAVCETQQVLGVIVNNYTYKGYDEVRDFLLNEYPDIQLYRKDETILNLDCKDEILKQ